MMNTKKKIIILILIAALILVIFGFTRMKTTSIAAIYEKESGISTSAVDVVYIEKTVEGKDPEIKDLSKDSNYYPELIETINSAKLRYSRKELGIDIGTELYTAAVTNASASDDSEIITMTFTEDGRMHVNASDRTYTLEDGSKVFQALKQAFE